MGKIGSWGAYTLWITFWRSFSVPLQAQESCLLIQAGGLPWSDSEALQWPRSLGNSSCPDWWLPLQSYKFRRVWTDAQTCAPLITDSLLSFITPEHISSLSVSIIEQKEREGETKKQWYWSLLRKVTPDPTPHPSGKFCFRQNNSFKVSVCQTGQLWSVEVFILPIPCKFMKKITFHQKRNLDWHSSPKEVHSL